MRRAEGKALVAAALNTRAFSNRQTEVNSQQEMPFYVGGCKGGLVPLIKMCCLGVGKGKDCFEGFLEALKPIAKLRLGPFLLPPSHLCAPFSVSRG